MNTTQIVTITFFQYEGWKDRWWAFTQMGIAPGKLQNIAGMTFAKLLGSGGGSGFNIWPNFGVYGLLAVWDNEQAARQFMQSNAVFGAFSKRSREQWTVFMRTLMSHGSWEGVNPFVGREKADEDAPVCVLTRATIKASKLWQFWQFVPRVSRSVEHQKGRRFSLGVGELPLIQQATFSLWDSSHAMRAYAYNNKFHKEVIRKTRALGWYKEELFARFTPYAEEGTWQGEALIRSLVAETN